MSDDWVEQSPASASADDWKEVQPKDTWVEQKPIKRKTIVNPKLNPDKYAPDMLDELSRPFTSAATSVADVLASGPAMLLGHAAATSDPWTRQNIGAAADLVSGGSHDFVNNPQEAYKYITEHASVKDLLVKSGLSNDQQVHTKNVLDNALQSYMEDGIMPSANAYFGDNPTGWKAEAKQLYTDIAGTVPLMVAGGAAGKLANSVARPSQVPAPKPLSPVEATSPATGLPEISSEFKAPELPVKDATQQWVEDFQKSLPLKEDEPSSVFVNPINTSPENIKLGNATVKSLPKISKEFKVKDETIPEGETPLPELNNAGFGPDVTESNQNPFISPTLTEQAKADAPVYGPGIGGMDFREIGANPKQVEALAGPTGQSALVRPETAEEWITRTKGEMNAEQRARYEKVKANNYSVLDQDVSPTYGRLDRMGKNSPGGKQGGSIDPEVFADGLRKVRDKIKEITELFTTKQISFDEYNKAMTPLIDSQREFENGVRKSIGNKQSGILNIGSVFDTVFGPNEKSEKFMKAKINALISPAESLADAIAMKDPKSPADLGSVESLPIPIVTAARGKFATTNQLSALYGKDHPVISYTMNKLYRTREWVAENKRKSLDNFSPIFKSPKDQVLKVLAAEQELQKPAWQERLTNPDGEATNEQLKSLGLNDKDIELYRNNRKAYDAEYERNVNAIKMRGGDVPELYKRKAYAPVSHGIGQFVLAAFEPGVSEDKGLRYYHRFETYAEMAEARNILKNDPEASKYDIQNRTPQSMGDGMLAMQDLSELPKGAAKIIAAVQELIDTKKKTFELQRAVNGVDGIVHYLKNGKPDPQLIEALKRRISLSDSLDTQSALYPLLKEMEGSNLETVSPNMFSLITSIVERELGRDVRGGGAKLIEQAGLHLADQIHRKMILSIRSIVNKDLRNLPSGELTVAPTYIDNLSKGITSLATTSALLINAKNMAQNFLTMPLNAVAVYLEAARLGGTPGQVMAWGTEANFHMLKGVMDVIHQGKSSEYFQFLQKEYKKGAISNHQFDEISNFASQFHGPVKTMEQGFNTLRKVTNDLPIEVPTNIVSHIYAYNLLEKTGMKAQLDKLNIPQSQRSALITQIAKSWTASYGTIDTPVGFANFGAVGRMAATFSRWNHNQVDRFWEGVRNLNDKDGTVFNRASFLFGTTVSYGIIAGLSSTVGLTSWDAFVHYFNKDKNPDEKLPTVDVITKYLGWPDWTRSSLLDQTGVDLASGQKYASTIESTIFPATWLKGVLGDVLPYWAKEAGIYDSIEKAKEGFLGSMSANTKPVGVGIDDKVKYVNALPAVMRGPMREALLSRDVPNKPGVTSILNQSGNVQYTQQNDQERILNKWMNMNTVRQKNEGQDKDFLSWYEGVLKAEPKAISNRLDQQIIEYKFSSNADEKGNKQLLEDIRTNAKKLMKLDPNALNGITAKVTGEYVKETMTAVDRLGYNAAIESGNAGKLLMIKKELDKIKTGGPVVQSGQTSLNQRP